MIWPWSLPGPGISVIREVVLQGRLKVEDNILIISKGQVEALIGRLADSASLEACIEEVQRMIAIKSTLAWRADSGS